MKNYYYHLIALGIAIVLSISKSIFWISFLFWFGLFEIIIFSSMLKGKKAQTAKLVLGSFFLIIGISSSLALILINNPGMVGIIFVLAAFLGLLIGGILLISYFNNKKSKERLK
jgi:hypothetical protein